MKNCVLPYLLALLCFCWPAEKKAPVLQGSLNNLAEKTVYLDAVADMGKLAGKTTHKHHRFMRRIPTQNAPAQQQVMLAGDDNRVMEVLDLAESEPVLAAQTGLRDVHFRHLYPSHYFW